MKHGSLVLFFKTGVMWSDHGVTNHRGGQRGAEGAPAIFMWLLRWALRWVPTCQE